ncbi:MAG: ribosome silencing factor [Alphaproteobacteria bacterium]|jgi:ribosome-associated protein
MDLFSDTPAPCLVDGNPCGAPGAFWRTQDILSEQIPADDSISLTTSREPPNQALLDQIVEKLDDDKAEDIVTIDMAGKSSMCDFMVIASGRSQRQVSAMAEHLAQMLKPQMPSTPTIEGLPQGDWVLVDAGDVIVHLFRPEVRTFYRLESMWGLETPEGPTGPPPIVWAEDQ